MLVGSMVAGRQAGMGLRAYTCQSTGRQKGGRERERDRDKQRDRGCLRL